MAEVRRCLRSGASRFSLKMSHRHLSRSHTSLGSSSIPGPFVPVDMLDVGLSEAGGAAAGGSRDGYTRLRPPFHSCGALQGPETRPAIRRNLPGCGCGFPAWRTGGWLGSGSSLPGGQLSWVRLYNGTRSEPLHKSKTGYYDVLEVQPAATQAQIKTAYYKQSFLYHPDRNSGSDEATERFSEISEAYTVLGNKGLRRKYDRGLLTLSDLTTTRRPAGKEASGRPQSRQAAVSAEQRGRIYDFDSFFKSHYSEQLQREKDLRVRREEIQRKKEDKRHELSMSSVMEISIVVMLLLAAGLIITVKKS